jgi:hypothetical protein
MTLPNMTLRMFLMQVAMAAAVPIISDVVAAHAATKPCDVMPERCQYAPSGVYYFYPPGYRMPGSTVTPALSARRNTAGRRHTVERKRPAPAARKATSIGGTKLNQP